VSANTDPDYTFRAVLSKPCAVTPKTADYYRYTINNKPCDLYDIAEAIGMTSHPVFHAFKKLARCGKGNKSAAQDLREAIVSLERALEMMGEEER
jgi:hypothetical protein